MTAMASTIPNHNEENKASLQPLSKALVDKAERELGEKPSWRDRDIDALRQLLDAKKGASIALK